MITMNDLVLASERVTPVTNRTMATYTISAYTVTKTTHHTLAYGDWDSFEVHVDKSKGEYLPRIYISTSIDINGNATPPRVTVLTTSYGDLTLPEYERFFIQVREGYEVARILEQVFCGKE